MNKSKKINNIFEKLEEREREVLKKIKKMGYKDPHKDFEHALLSGDNRRFITDILTIDYGDIEEKQVAVEVVNKERCKLELQPLFEKQGLYNPPLVVESAIPGKYDQLTGHHRAYTLQMMNGCVIVIVVTRNYNLKGNLVPPDLDLIQGIRANPPQTNRSYDTEDAVLMIQESMRINPTQDGLNPNGKLPPRHSDKQFDFDDLVDRIYSQEYFPHKSTRTKIRNRVLQVPVASKIIDIDFNEQTNHLVRIGWDAGLKTQFTRKEPQDHFDSSRKTIILMSDDNGRHFDEKMLSVVKKYHTDEDFVLNLKNNDIKFIDIAGRIYKPSCDQTALDQSRSNFKKNVQGWNEYLKKANVDLEIRYLAFPKQLKINSDSDKKLSV